MAQTTIYETGDSLEALAEKARHWFITNNVAVPAGARKWQTCSVRRGKSLLAQELLLYVDMDLMLPHLYPLSPVRVIRQEKYDKLFNTVTKHTADFYIPSLNLVLEVTSSTNN